MDCSEGSLAHSGHLQPITYGGDGENRTLKYALQRRQFPVSLHPRTYKFTLPFFNKWFNF